MKKSRSLSPYVLTTLRNSWFGGRNNAESRTSKVGVFAAGRISQLGQLAQQQRILEYALDRLDEKRLQGRRVLLVGIVRPQKLVQGDVRLWNDQPTAADDQQQQLGDGCESWKFSLIPTSHLRGRSIYLLVNESRPPSCTYCTSTQRHSVWPT